MPISGYGYRWGAWFDRSGELVELAIAREAKYRRITQAGAVAGSLAYPECPSGAAEFRTTVAYRERNPTRGRLTIRGPYGLIVDLARVA